MKEECGEIRGLFEFIGFVRNGELNDVMSGYGLGLWKDVADAAESDDLNRINFLVRRGRTILGEISVLAEKHGVPFYPHDLQHLDGGIGLNNLIGLAGGRISSELKEVLRGPTEEERKFGMVPPIEAVECEYNVVGYFLAVLLKKLCGRLEELRAQF